jgi:hypothetical protein
VSYVGTANSGADAFQPSRSNTKPGGAAVGDIAIFYLGRWHESASFPAIASAPANAVLLETLAIGNLQLLVYAKYVEASETTYTFNWTTSRWSRLWSTYFSGRASGLTLSALARQAGTGSANPILSRTVTAATGDDLAWGVGNHEYSGGETHTAPTSFTKVDDNEAGAAAYRLNVSSGSQTASGGTISSAQNHAVCLIALPAASSGAAMNLNTATGSGAAQALSSSKAATLSSATGSGAAQSVSLSKALALGSAAGSGAAQSMSSSKAPGLGAATGSGAAQALTAAKALGLSAAAGSGVPQPMTFTADVGVTLGPATGTGSPQPMTFSKGLTLGAATGAGAPAAIALSKGLALGSAAGAGAVQALAPSKALSLPNATGAGAVQSAGFTAAGSMPLGTAAGTGAPQPMAFSKALTLSPGAGSGVIQALAYSKAPALGVVTGAGAAQVLAAAKALALGRAQGFGDVLELTLDTGGIGPEYEAPEDWTLTTPNGVIVTGRSTAYRAVTRRPAYTATTREDL